MKKYFKLIIILVLTFLLTGTITSVKAMNSGNFLNREDPLAVTVTFYDEWNSRGFTWTTTVKMNNPHVLIKKTDNNFTEDFSNATIVNATENVIDGTYYLYKAHVTEMEEGNYIYKVGTTNNYSEVGHICVKNETEGFEFLFVTDPQDYDETGFSCWADLLQYAFATCPNASFICDGGDTVNNSHDAIDHDMDQWIYAMELPEEMKNTVIVPTAGNHDSWGTSFADHFDINYQGSTNTGGYYSFNYGNAFFLVCNTNDSGSSISTQVEWIDKQLQETEQEWKFVLMHKGLISTGDHSNESDVAEWRNLLLPVMAKNEVDFVMQGHDHVYVRSMPYLYGQNNGSNYSGKIPNMQETNITELYNGEEITYSVEPSGTFYVTANYAGRKSYPPVDYDKTLIYPAINPYNGKAMSQQIQQQMFSTIKVKGNCLYFNSYIYDGNETVTLYDTYNIKKNTYQIVEELLENCPNVSDIDVSKAELINTALVEANKLVEKAKNKLSISALEKLEAYGELDIQSYLNAYSVYVEIEALKNVVANKDYSLQLKQLKADYTDLTENEQALVSNANMISIYEDKVLSLYKVSAFEDLLKEYKAGKVTKQEVELAFSKLNVDEQKLCSDQSFTGTKKSGCNNACYDIFFLTTLLRACLLLRKKRG